MNAVLGRVVVMELDLVVKVAHFIMSLVFTRLRKQRRMLLKSMSRVSVSDDNSQICRWIAGENKIP